MRLLRYLLRRNKEKDEYKSLVGVTWGKPMITKGYITSLETIKGVGKKTADLFREAGIKSVEDLAEMVNTDQLYKQLEGKIPSWKIAQILAEAKKKV